MIEITKELDDFKFKLIELKKNQKVLQNKKKEFMPTLIDLKNILK